MLQFSYTALISISALLALLLQVHSVTAASAAHLPLAMVDVTPYNPEFCDSHNDYEQCEVCDKPCPDNRNYCCGYLHSGTCRSGVCKCGSAYDEQMEDMSSTYLASGILEQTNYMLPRRYPDIISSSFF